VKGFLNNDYVGISWLHHDALVVSLTIANHNVHQILGDSESLADILYWMAFEKLKLNRDKIVPVHFPLMGLPLLKCISKAEANYVLREIDEGVCGSHAGSRMLTHKVIRFVIFSPT
jgi:hypothetical protein